MRAKSKLRVALEIILRVVVFTIVGTLLAFAVGLLSGIAASVVYGAIRHVQPDMTWAYKFVAAPFAALALVIIFFSMLISEIRRARRPLLHDGGHRPLL